MSISFLDYLFWSRYATRLAPADFYFELHREFRARRRGVPDEPGPARELFRGLEAARLPGAAPPWPDDGELRAARDDTRRWTERGYRLLLPGDPAWPAGPLTGISDPPRGLFAWGAPEILRAPLLAVVGSRDVSRPTLAWLEGALAEFLREHPDANLVSGGARGVDQCAHRSALRQGRPTAVLLPGGFSRLYPGELARWSGEILRAGGCFLSEYAPPTLMRKSFFGERNRLISAFSRAVLIVEARRRSGTLLTAKAAAEQARAVFVVPGAPYDPQFAGSLDLLAEGATLVRDAQELSVFFRVEIRNSYYGLKASSRDSDDSHAQH